MIKPGVIWADNTIIGAMNKNFHDEKIFEKKSGLNIIIFNQQELKKQKKNITNIFTCFKGINDVLNLNVFIYYNGQNHYKLIKYNDNALLTREELEEIPNFIEYYKEKCTE